MYSETSSTKRRHQMYYDSYHTRGWVDVPDGNWMWRFTRGFTAGSLAYATQSYFNTLLTSYTHLRTVYHPPLTLNEFKNYFSGIFKQEFYKQNIRREVLYGLTYGGIDMGFKLAVFRFLTEGINEIDDGFETDYWRKPIPIFFAALFTSWTRAPFEISRKAYFADQKFPAELRQGYTSIRGTFFSLLRKNPYFLIKNSYPTIWASFLETFFGFWIYDHFKSFSRFYVENMHYNEGVMKAISGVFATGIALGFGIMHDIFLRNLVEKQVDPVAVNMF